MSNISHVLCPIDFSDCSTHAVEQAAAVAGWYKARLTALHVCAPLFMPTPTVPPTTALSEFEHRRVRDRASAFVRQAVSSSIGVDVTVAVGEPVPVILECASRLPADLIVLGTHGATGFEHLVLGSVTEKVLRKATCPVLTVPPRAQSTSRFPFRRVLCAVDFSVWSSMALEFAFSLAAESGASVDLLHVIEWPWHEPPPPPLTELAPEQASALIEFRRYLVTGATDRLESLAANAVRHPAVVSVSVAHGKPYVEILRAAAAGDADLIVMGVHGRNPVDLTLFGSTTNHVVRRATCPVLTLRR